MVGVKNGHRGSHTGSCAVTGGRGRRSAGEGAVGRHPVCRGHRACGGGVGRDLCPLKSLGDSPSSPPRLLGCSPQPFLAYSCIAPVCPCHQTAFSPCPVSSSCKDTHSSVTSPSLTP